MTAYAVNELPNIEDPDLVRYWIFSQEMRQTLSAFMQHVLSQLCQHPVTASVRVALAIVDRTAEGSLSVELLCIKNRVRDAAILLLSLYELQLDLQYIALDLSRAGTWLDHTREDKKPWSVATQMQEIFAAGREIEAERRLYRMLSMVKHCNPAGANFVFPIAATRDTLQLDPGDGNSPLIRPHMFALGCRMHNTGAAASRIWASQGLDVGDFVHRLGEQFEKLSKRHEQYILRAAQQIAASPTPDDVPPSNGT
jgi:hypothetical protein